MQHNNGEQHGRKAEDLLGRNMPRPVQKLLAIAYGTEKQAEAMVEILRKRDT